MAKDANEVEQWKDYIERTRIKSIDIPYSITLAAANIVGVFHLREPFEESSTEGVVAGVIIGSYNINKNNAEARIPDVTGNLLRLVMVLDFPGKELRARVDTRRWDGGWNDGSWAIIWRG